MPWHGQRKFGCPNGSSAAAPCRRASSRCGPYKSASKRIEKPRPLHHAELRSRATPPRSSESAKDRAPTGGRGPADRRRRCRSRRFPRSGGAPVRRRGAPPRRRRWPAHRSAAANAARTSARAIEQFVVAARIAQVGFKTRFGHRSLAQIERERKFRHRPSARRTAMVPGRVAHAEESRQTAALGLEGIDRKALVAPAAGMRDMILAAALGAVHPRIEQIEGQRRMHADASDAAPRRAATRGSAPRRRTRRLCPVGRSGSARPLQVTR